MRQLGALVLLWTVAAAAGGANVVVRLSGQTVATVQMQAPYPVSLDSRNGVVIVRCEPHPLFPSKCYDALDFHSSAPSITLVASAATPPIRADGTYAPGTRITLTAPGLGSIFSLCERQSFRSPDYPTGLDWSGLHERSVAAQSVQVTLGRALSRYDFTLRCWGDTGARSSNRFQFYTGN